MLVKKVINFQQGVLNLLAYNHTEYDDTDASLFLPIFRTPRIRGVWFIKSSTYIFLLADVRNDFYYSFLPLILCQTLSVFSETTKSKYSILPCEYRVIAVSVFFYRVSFFILSVTKVT